MSRLDQDGRRVVVVGEARGGREAVESDLAMPGVGGLEALPLIRAVAPDARVVVLSGLDPSDVADEAVACAAGYVHKGNPEDLVNQLNRILAVAAA